MNVIFLSLVFIAFFNAAYRQLSWVPAIADEISPMQALTEGMIQSGKGSVELALGLIGVMAFFLGLMKVAEEGGLLRIIARLVQPVMVRLFPEVPAEHPAMGAMILNISANAMGLGNAATPFGIRAMQELNTLNPIKGTASNAMVLFLAINTSSVTLLPTGVIALRAAAGSNNPAGILATTLFATLCSTTVAILAAKQYQRFSPIPSLSEAAHSSEAKQDPHHSDMKDGFLEEGPSPYSTWVAYAAIGFLILLVPVVIVFGKAIGPWIIPALAVILLGFGTARGIRVYEVFVEGAKDGFHVAVKIIPFLVAILVSVGMFRDSGALDIFIGLASPFTTAIGLPAEVLPMAMIRPLSGSGAFGLLAETINNPEIGPDSYIGYLVSTLQGSTETTFYVLAVYFGAVQVRKNRHALAAGLTADIAGIVGAVIACSYLYG